MTDGHQRFGPRADGGPETGVASLASRAVVALASKRSGNVEPLSERLTEALIKAVSERGEGRAHGALTDILNCGVPADEIVDHYIPEAARRLGEAWSADRTDFATVTIGAARLQRALRDLSAQDRHVTAARASGNVVLVAVPEGQHHTLGAMIAAEQLRRAGHSVRLMLGASPSGLRGAVADGHFDAIFLSAAAPERLAELGKVVEKLRTVSRKRTPIAVGGPVGNADVDVKTLTGADCVATDVREALRQCGLTALPRGAERRAMTE